MITEISSMCISTHQILKLGVGVSLDLYVDGFDTATNTIYFGKVKYKNGVEDSFRCFQRENFLEIWRYKENGNVKI